MTSPNLAQATHQIHHLSALLQEYSFDGALNSPDRLVEQWLESFNPVWVSHAIVEALYQGRYKLISVEQILQLWQRRGHPIRHFSREFESIILGQTLPTSAEPPAAQPLTAAVASPAMEVRANAATETQGTPPTDWPEPVLTGEAIPWQGRNPFLDLPAAGTPDNHATRLQPTLPLLPGAASAPGDDLTNLLEGSSGSDFSSLQPSPPLPGEPVQPPAAAAASSVPWGVNADLIPEPLIPTATPIGPIPTDGSLPQPIKPFQPRSDGSSVMHRRLRAVVQGNGDLPES